MKLSHENISGVAGGHGSLGHFLLYVCEGVLDGGMGAEHVQDVLLDVVPHPDKQLLLPTSLQLPVRHHQVAKLLHHLPQFRDALLRPGRDPLHLSTQTQADVGSGSRHIHTDCTHFMKLIFKLFVILHKPFYTTYAFRMVYLLNVHYFDNNVFTGSVINSNYIYIYNIIIIALIRLFMPLVNEIL